MKPRLGVGSAQPCFCPPPSPAHLKPSPQPPAYSMKGMRVESPWGWFLLALPHLVEAELPAWEGEGETQREALPTQALLLLEVHNAVHDVVEELRWRASQGVAQLWSFPAPDIRSKLWLPAVQSPGPHPPGWSRPGW